MQLSLKDTLREARSAQMHTCAGMVLGIRMAILGCRLVGISEPRVEKVLKVYVEMDRCFTDAVGFLTGCSLGKRSLQHIDYGKPAATFHNTASEMAYRIAVPPDLRAYMESEKNGPRYGSGSKADLQKLAYCELPDYMMFRAERVKINRELIATSEKAVTRELCRICREEINDRKGFFTEAGCMCKHCENPSNSYYTV
ncbi:MAG: formylmethanofuran dehydrogenase subunit E family protein [SAR202 cluster bacterium]|jgi:formylmethanofuran dehydrogenase subunit E|nr:formylmethanofuran dehydrogenase subunit E family protein [SAR202 cluster bacterium]|tara:strand:+ start:8379 stop:8972 length:594 start_codon:yes stop_codon:yes gene_type:complete